MSPMTDAMMGSVFTTFEQGCAEQLQKAGFERGSVPLVIYHGNCQDGFTAAWACWLRHPDWEFFPATHGEPPPDVRDRLVYMLDFSYKLPVMKMLLVDAYRIVVLDHHKTAQADLDVLIRHQLIRGEFNLEKSGARLAWEWFHAGKEVPDLIKHVEDRDLWRFKYEDTKAISAWLFSQPYDFDTWDFAAGLIANETQELNEVVMAGNTVLQKESKDIAELCQKKFLYWIGGYEVWAVNLPYTMASDAGHLLCQGEPFVASFYYDGTGFCFSLRSAEDGIDVSEVAKLYGGGGHKHAAGFKMKSKLIIEPEWPTYLELEEAQAEPEEVAA